MRRLFTAVFFLLAAVPAAGQPFSTTITANAPNARPGGTVQLTVTVRNDGPKPYSGPVNGNILVEKRTGWAIASVTSSDPSITARRTTSGTSTLDNWNCRAGAITLGAGATITFTVNVTAPKQADDQTTTVFGAAFTFTNTATGQSITLRVSTTPAPQLAIRVFREPDQPDEVNGSLSIYYDIIVTNVGNAPTQGPITVDLEAQAPPGMQPPAFTPEIAPSQVQWTFTAAEGQAKAKVTTSRVIEPEHQVRLELTAVYVNVARGAYSFRATVSGGGAPTVTSEPDTLLNVRPPAPAPPPQPPVGIGGRKR